MNLSDILLTDILLLVQLSEMSDTRLSVTPDQRYSDLSDILITVILLLVRLSEISDTRLSVTPDQRYSDLSDSRLSDIQDGPSLLPRELPYRY